jgi:hypothetical protein
MAHFAKINKQNIVEQVLVIEQGVIDTGAFGDPASFIRTSYNTRGGIHILGGTPLRKNYAAIGYHYDPERDAFIPPVPQIGGTWIFSEDKCLWERPVAYPTDGKIYNWDENTTSWIEASNQMTQGQ